jgi:NIMA (never in mitosis gene a)-related kinase 1/4/5
MDLKEKDKKNALN